MPFIKQKYAMGGFDESYFFVGMLDATPERMYPTIEDVRRVRAEKAAMYWEINKWLNHLAEPYGLKIRDPFTDQRIKDYFFDWSYAELTKGFPKYFLHNAFTETRDKMFGRIKILGHCKADTRYHVCTHRHLVGYY
jgi:hypothetical protein